MRYILIFLVKEYFYVPKIEVYFNVPYKQYFYVHKNELHFYEWREIERMAVKAAYMQGIIKNMDKCAQGKEKVMDNGHERRQHQWDHQQGAQERPGVEEN